MAHSPTVTAAELEELYGITLPQRLREFFDSGEYEKFEGKYVADLEGLDGDAKMKVAFAHEVLPGVYGYAADFFRCTPDKLFPLAKFVQRETSLFLSKEGLTDLMALEKLPNLRKVQTYYCVADEEIEDFRQARPDVDVS